MVPVALVPAREAGLDVGRPDREDEAGDLRAMDLEGEQMRHLRVGGLALEALDEQGAQGLPALGKERAQSVTAPLSDERFFSQA